MVESSWAHRERAWLAVKFIALLGAVMWPLKEYRYPREQRIDGFPFSFYPMFTTHRTGISRVVSAVGVSSSGARRYLPHKMVGDGGENQVRHQLFRAAVRENRAQRMADRTAARVSANPRFADLVRVEIVSGLFDLDACMLSRRFEAEETMLASTSLPPMANPPPSTSLSRSPQAAAARLVGSA